MRYYIYKITFENGCTYVGQHVEKKPNDGYITSSRYFRKHPELKYTREELIEVKDKDTLDIMETICIFQNIRDNYGKCVNGNYGNWYHHFGAVKGHKGYYHTPEQRKAASERMKARIANGTAKCFGHGQVCSFKGEANGFYGKHHSKETLEHFRLLKIEKGKKKRNLLKERFKLLEDGFTKKDLAAFLNKEVENIQREWALYKEVHSTRCEKLNEEISNFPNNLNKQQFVDMCKSKGIANIQNRWIKYNSGRKIKHYWFWNSVTFQETYLPFKPEGEGWERGRLPHQYWSEERKQSYREKHGGPSKLSPEERKLKWGNNHSTKGRVVYTNGERDIYLIPGQDVPEGFRKGGKPKHTNKYKGCTWFINDNGEREWQKK